MAERSYIKGDRPVPDYRLVKFLGKGGFGEVWQATGPGGIEVALKIIPLDNKQGFKEFRAIRMVKNVRNAHLVPIIGFWLKDSNGNLFDDQAETDSFIIKGKATELIIAMGLGEKSLMDRLEECQKEGTSGIPSEELLIYMDGAARAIDFLNRPIHNSGSGQIAIQHCDVKPQNIMIVGGEAQLCDFGLARVLGDPRTTQSGNMMMSVPYTSPEMFEASKPSHSSDQYALAVTYYELRTGELPFENPGNPASMMYQIMQGKLDLSRLTDPAEREVIKKATSLAPDKRYATSMEMLRELRRIIEGAVTTPPSKPTGPKPPPGPEAPGTEIVPGYRLVRRLGQGGYGTVWEAQAPGGKRVAIKVIHDVQGSSGRQEFRALELIKALDHEHLLDLHAYWLKDQDGDIIPDEVRNQPDAPPAHTLVIATKLAAKNLLQRLNECQREGHPGIPLTELLTYMRQAAQAIDFLNEPRHRFGDQVMSIQHRDIKPENILLVGKTAKVGDFGLAKVLEGTSGQVHGNSTGYTPHYAAPELFRGQVTRWTDQYSLAITYFKLRTGRLPFDANISLGDLLMMHLEGHLDLSVLSESERGIIARATSADAEKRYPTCLDMVNALERVLSGEIRQPKPPLGPTNPEISLPIPSPKPAASSKRPKPASTPDGFTIRPEDEDGSVVVTTPERDEPAEDLVDWPIETQPPKHDTPVPMNQPAVVPDWRGHAAAKKEASEKAAATQRPPSHVEMEAPDWRTGTRQQRKLPVGLLAAVVLIVGVGVTAASVTFFLKRGGEKTQSSVEPSVANAKPTETATRPQTRPETQPGPKPTVSSETPEQKAQKLLEQATAGLGSDNVGALHLFEQVSRMPVAAEFKDRAKLGQARAQARLGHWDKVRDLPSEGNLGPTDRALRRALQLKTEAPAGVDGQTDDGKLVALLDQLIPLKADREFWKSLERQPEGQWTRDLGKQVVTALSAKIKDVVAHAQQRTEPEIDKALNWAPKIARYDDAQANLPARTRQEAVKNIIAAADQVPREQAINPLLSPWKDHGEDQVFDWLNLAYHLAGDDLPEKARKDLVVAAGAKEDLEVARKVLQKLHLEKKAEDIPYLLVKAKSQPLNRAGYKVAFETYADLVDLVVGRKDLPLRDRKEKVLEPALERGERAVNTGNRNLGQRLAECYQAKIKLIQDSSGSSLWADEAKELRESYAAAIRHWPSPTLRLEFSEFRREQALGLVPGSHEQLELLRNALNDLQKEPPDHPNPVLVYHERGLILEDLGDMLWYPPQGSHDRKALSYYGQAVKADDAAIGKTGNKNPEYLLYRGRCYYKWFYASADQARLKSAEESLTAALTGGLAPARQSEAHQWLGRCLALQKPPDYARAVQELNLAFSSATPDKSAPGAKTAMEVALNTNSCKMALEALGFVGDRALSLYQSGGKATDRNTCLTCCESLARYSRAFGDELADQYEFLGADLLTKFGVAALERKVSTDDVIASLKKGLPANLSETRFTQVKLLNLRNILLLKPFLARTDQFSKQDTATLEALLKDIDLDINLAKGDMERYMRLCALAYGNPENRKVCEQTYRTDVPFAARLSAAQCCLLLKKKQRGLDYVRQALQVEGITPKVKETAIQVEQALRKLGE